VNALVHPTADVDAIREHFTTLHQDRGILERLRAQTLRDAPNYTWMRAGERLLEVYEEVVAEHAGRALTRAA
jgi:glycosyltransferase involved in cell wall biosynthesis